MQEPCRGASPHPRSGAVAERSYPTPEVTGKFGLGVRNEAGLQIDYILCSQRWKSSVQSAKTGLGADCGSDHELLIAKFRLKLKTVGKTTKPFRYDLNQIPYDYTVEVRNKFKGLDLIESLMNY